MCAGCGVSEAVHGQLLEAARAWEQVEPPQLGGELPYSGELPPQGVTWLSTGMGPRTSERECLLIRDAVSSLARVFFDRDDARPVVVAWHRSITPLLLDVAANFGGGEPHETLVWVICAHQDERTGLLQMADWRRGRLLDMARDHARHSVANQLGALVFVNGAPDCADDDQSLPQDIARFALASTGGQAAELARHAPSPGAYAGGDVQFADELADEHTSYLVVMHKIVEKLGSTHSPLVMTSP